MDPDTENNKNRCNNTAMGEQQTGAEHGTKQRTETWVIVSGDRKGNDSPGAPSLGLVGRLGGCSIKLMRASVARRAGAAPAVSTLVVATSTAWGAAAARAFELIGIRDVGGRTVDGRTSGEGVGRRGTRDDESRWRWASCDD